MPVVRADPAAVGPWERRGECNHCGWCCTFLGRRTMKFTGKSEDYDRRYLELRGARMSGERTGEAPIAIYLPCTAHDPAPGRCTVYDERPRTCRDYPWTPEQVRGIPCSYWFERKAGGGVERVGGLGSPHPTPGADGAAFAPLIR